MGRRPSIVRIAGASIALAAAFVVTGCEPDFDIDGAFFPAWIFCMAAGGVLSIAAHALFVKVRVDPYLGPPLLIYPSLYILLTTLTWLVLFRT